MVLAILGFDAVGRPASADVAEESERPAALRLLPLGDSITYGVRAEPHAGYRLPLGRLLQEAGLSHRFVGTRGVLHDANRTDIPHNAYPGFSVRQLLEALQEEDVFARLAASGEQADVVLLHIGTNDLSPVQGSIGDAFETLRTLLHYLDAQRGVGLSEQATVLLAKILPHTRAPDGTFDLAQVERTRRFNDLLAERIPGEFGHFVHLVNMFRIPLDSLTLVRLGVGASTLDPEGEGHVSWLRSEAVDGDSPPFRTWYINTLLMNELRVLGRRTTFDGLHPTPLGYEVMAHQWMTYLQPLTRRDEEPAAEP